MGTTPKYALPYVEPSDPVANYPATGKANAEAVEAALGGAAYRTAAGSISMPVPTANGGTSATVTFPVGRFTQPPIVSATAFSNGYGAGSIGTPSAAACPVKYYNPTASVPSTPWIYWIAVQMTPSSGSGLMAETTDGAVVTCHTEGCGNGGIAIDIDAAYIDADGVTQPVTYVVCGVCSQPITDIKR